MTPNPNLQTFAERLRFQRQRLDLNQAQLGEKVGVVQSTVSSWESTDAAPCVDVLIALCNLFGVAADYLIGRSDSENGLAPDQWIVDEAAVEKLRSDPKAKKERIRWAAKVPRRAKILDHDQVEQLRRELEGS